MKKALLISVVAFFVCCVALAQSVPELVNYQGMLTVAGGKAFTGQKKLQFRIWDSAEGGNVVWGPQTMDPVPVVSGQFNVILSKADSNGPAVTTAFTGPNCFLGIKVADTGTANMDAVSEIAPRQQILSAPFSFNAASLNGVDAAKILLPDMTGTVKNSATFSGKSIEDLFQIIGTAEGQPHSNILKVADFPSKSLSNPPSWQEWKRFPFHLNKKAQLLISLAAPPFSANHGCTELGIQMSAVTNGNSAWTSSVVYFVLNDAACASSGVNNVTDSAVLDPGSYELVVNVILSQIYGGSVPNEGGWVTIVALPSL